MKLVDGRIIAKWGNNGVKKKKTKQNKKKKKQLDPGLTRSEFLRIEPPSVILQSSWPEYQGPYARKTAAAMRTSEIYISNDKKRKNKIPRLLLDP